MEKTAKVGRLASNLFFWSHHAWEVHGAQGEVPIAGMPLGSSKKVDGKPEC
jgi:hypothetical protein